MHQKKVPRFGVKFFSKYKGAKEKDGMKWAHFDGQSGRGGGKSILATTDLVTIYFSFFFSNICLVAFTLTMTNCFRDDGIYICVCMLQHGAAGS